MAWPMPAFLKLQRYARHVIDDCAFAARVEASYGVAFVLSLAGLAGTLLGARQARHMLAASGWWWWWWCLGEGGGGGGGSDGVMHSCYVMLCCINTSAAWGKYALK